jgi:hypothetical protein
MASRYNLRPRLAAAAVAPKKAPKVAVPSNLPPRTWKTLVAAAAIIENKMPYEVVHDVKYLYTVLKSLAAYKLNAEKSEHLWQYRIAMSNYENQMIEYYLPHIDEHVWYYEVIELFRRQNYSAIQSCLYEVIKTYEIVSNLEELIDAVSITSNDMEED